MPKACAATAMRAPFINDIIYLIKPNFLLPTKYAGVLLKVISQVGDPWMPSFSSILSMFIVSSFWQTNMDKPRPSLVPLSERASTNSVVPFPLVIKRLVPFIRHTPFMSPSSGGVATVLTDCKSDPKSGSVRTIAPVASPAASSGIYFSFWSSLPKSSMVSAISCKPTIVIKEASARETISIIEIFTVWGIFSPPYSYGSDMPIKFISLKSFMFSNTSGFMVTSPFSQTWPSSSICRERSKIGPAQMSPTTSKISK